MSLSATDRMATGWFLTINNAERKKLTVFEVRCSHGGCLLAAVVTIDKELYIPGVTDSTKTETHPTALRDVPPEAMLRMLGIDYQPRHPEALPGRLTAEALREMTVNEFLTGFSGAPRGFSMADIAAVDPGHRHGWLDEWEKAKAVRVRCRHLEGWLSKSVFALDKKVVRADRVVQFE